MIHYPENANEKIEIGNHVLYIENNILFSITSGNYYEENAFEIKEVVLDLLKSRNSLNMFVDMNKIGKVTPEARKISNDIMVHEKINKIAFVGVHLVARVVAEFIMQFSGNKKSKFFKNKEDALIWLSI
jgi:hypothetical protein